MKTLGAIMISVVNLLIFLFQRFFQWIFAKLESSASDEVKIFLLPLSVRLSRRYVKTNKEKGDDEKEQTQNQKFAIELCC